MNPLVLLAASENGGQIQQIAQTFGVDWPHLAAQVVSFSIVCVLLQRFAYNPVLKMLQDRRAQIEEGIANTEKDSRRIWLKPRLAARKCWRRRMNK